MEDENKLVIQKNGFIKHNILKENLTFIDISNQNLSYINGNIKLPTQLCEINLSHSNLIHVPRCVMDHFNIRKLDLSNNNIEAFDETPNFCHVIEDLDISNNNILHPPNWIWMKSPKNLSKLNISDNIKLTDNLEDEILQYKTLVKEVIIFNCRINKSKELIGTFTNTKLIQLGCSHLVHYKANALNDIPCGGLTDCFQLEKLNVNNTLVENITPMIGIYKNLIEIDLSYNNISGLPKEFGTLKNLEVCLLSFNQIIYLPDEIVDLEKLKVLSLNSNDLCMLPNYWSKLKNLESLDLYDNGLYDVPEIEDLNEIDLAQNYLDEPDTESYFEKRNKIRLKYKEERYSGRKEEVNREESYYSSNLTDDEKICYEDNESLPRPASESSEDWDAEDWWIPHNVPCNKQPPHSSWLMFLKQKLEAGHFCPIDLHNEPINKTRSKVFITVPGQFDDYSDDDK